MDADHPHCPEVPDDHPHCWVVHSQVVGLKHFSGKEKRAVVNIPSLDSSDMMSLPAWTHPRYMKLNQKSSMREERMSQPWMN